MTQLSVNLNKFALLRNSRGRDYPNVVRMGARCLRAGAQGITIHPRPDQRHAKYSDVRDLKTLIRQYPNRELNIEGNPLPNFSNAFNLPNHSNALWSPMTRISSHPITDGT